MLIAKTFVRGDGSEIDRIWSDQDRTPDVEAAAALYFTAFLGAAVLYPLEEENLGEDDENDFFRPRGV